MTPSYDSHCHPSSNDSKLDEIIHLIHKLGRKLDRLTKDQDFSREDASVRRATKKVVAATQNVNAAHERIPINPQPKEQ